VRSRLGSQHVPCLRRCHREVWFAFPPSSLVRAAVEKACARTGPCASMVVLAAVLAPRWSTLPWPDPSARAELAIFACDFGRLEPRLGGLPPLSSCPGASARRQHHLCGSVSDALDRHRLREAMLAQQSGRPLAGDAAGGDAMEED
jgi:hypothetical protein